MPNFHKASLQVLTDFRTGRLGKVNLDIDSITSLTECSQEYSAC